MAMVFWDAKERGGDGPITKFALAHKITCDDGTMQRSVELGWLDTPRDALTWLAHNCDEYEWTPKQYQRLIKIAWAVSETKRRKTK
jgi:hypothetical protein